MSGKKKSHFSVGECGELIFTKGTVKIFDLRENGNDGTVKNGFLSHFWPIFLNHIPPQPSITHIPCTMLATPPPFP